MNTKSSPKLAGAASPALSYTIKDAAAATGLSRSTLYNLMNAGRLTFVKIGSRRLITAASLTTLIQGAQ